VPICMAILMIELSTLIRFGNENSVTSRTEPATGQEPHPPTSQPDPATSQPVDRVSRIFRTSSRRCNIDVSGIAKSDFKSMSGEDLHLMNNFFKGLCNGTYVEIGGLDGVTISNSYVFNKELGWKGVLIEGN
jgi:hypothetical protein